MKAFTVPSLLVLLLWSTGGDAQPLKGDIARYNGTLSVKELVVDRIYQRVGTAKTITFSGTYTGFPDAIDVQIVDATTSAVLVDWTTIQSGPVGGTFSGQLSVPQYNGWMKWRARIHALPSTSVTSTRKFGVGALILLTGQSNMAGMWAISSGSPPTPTSNARRYAGAGWFAVDAAAQAGEVNDGYGTGRGGDGICEFANRMNTLLGVNVGLLQYAAGGTSSTQWAPGGSMYIQTIGPGRSNPRGITYPDVGSDAELVLHYQGETDAIAGVSSSAWQTSMESTYAGFKANTRSGLVLGLQVLGWTIARPGLTDTNWSTIKSAQLSYVAAKATPSVFVSAYGTDGALMPSVPIHYTAASYRRFAYRLSQSYAYYLGLATYSGKGPSIADVKWSSESSSLLTVNVTPSPGASIRDGAGGSGGSLNGFRVFNGVTQLTIISTSISGNSVLLTMSAPISRSDITAGSVKLDSEFGQSPHGTANPPNLANYVFDTAVPVGDTRQLPMLPTSGQIMVTE